MSDVHSLTVLGLVALVFVLGPSLPVSTVAAIRGALP